MKASTADDDRGVTLVELIVGITVAALMLSLIASVFINGFTAQREGVARDAATGAANVVATSLSTSVRNAATIRANTAGTRLDAMYVAADGTPECRAWELRAGELLYRADESGALPPADANWGALATGVRGTLTGGALFNLQNGTSLTIGMDITVDGVTVAVTDGVVAQAVTAGGLSC